ncbi:MAG: DUF4335 domain-containing protein [Leptolyngbyaceae cyanobacterium]
MATIELTHYRYETPTAKLTVAGRSLAISQWSDQPVVQPMRFQLTVHGPERDPIEISGKQADLIALKTLVQGYLQGGVGQAAQPVTESGLTLAPEGIHHHRLTLGPLSSDPAISHLVLSTLELSDWIDLFDQLEGQVRCLPVPLNPAARRSPWQQWSSLAAVFIVSVGTVAVWPYLNRDRSLPTASQAPIEAPPFETVEEPATESTESAETEQISADAQPADEAPAAVSPAPSEKLDQPQPKSNSPSDLPTRPGEIAAEPQAPQSVPPAPEARTQAPETGTLSEALPAPTAARIPEAGADQLPGRPENLAGGATEPYPVPEAASPLAFEEATSLPRQWSPPVGFTGVLSYQITLTTEGRIEEIAPADEQSAEYQDQTGLPAIGSVINDIEPGETLNIIFYDDGTVEITPE